MDEFMHSSWDDHHMLEGWPMFPFFGWGMTFLWLLVSLIIALLVYQDANRRGMNGLLWFVLVILPIVGLVFLILYLVLRERTGMQPIPAGDHAMDLLRERYAHGEIDEEEFRRRRKELERKD